MAVLFIKRTLCVLLFLCTWISVFAQVDCGYSDLQESTLAISYNSCTSPISAFPCAVKIKNINTEVICDGASELAIQINYTGDNGYMRVEVLDSENSPIKDLVKSSTVSAVSNRPQTFTIRVKDEIEKDFNSMSVLVTFARLRSQLNRVNATQIRFNCPKQWCTLADTEACNKPIAFEPVVNVKAIAVGLASTYDLSNLIEPCKVNQGKTNPNSSEGISQNTINLDDYISGTNDFSISALLNIDKNIFVDNNPESNTFYWKPASYNLGWTPTNGYSTKHIYSKRSSGQDAQFYAQVSPNIPNNADQIISKIISTTKGNTPVEIRPMPIVGNPEVKNDWVNLYGTNPSIVSGGSGLDSPLNLELKTDKEGIANISVALANNIGLNGQVVFSTGEEGFPKQEIPMSINLTRDAHRILAPNEIRKGSRAHRYFTNESCYPIELHTLNFLVLANKGNCQTKAVVLQWQLSDNQGQNIRLPGNTKAYIELDKRLETLLKDNQYTLIRWVDFEVLEDTGCSAEILNSIIAPVFDFDAAIDVKTVPAMFSSAPNLSEVIVEVRSRQFSPTQSETLVRSISFSRDGEKSKKVSPFFTTANSNGINYEYRVQLVNNNGDKYQSTWSLSNEQSLFLGPGPLSNKIPNYTWVNN